MSGEKVFHVYRWEPTTTLYPDPTLDRTYHRWVLDGGYRTSDEADTRVRELNERGVLATSTVQC